jgi:hypothetical protein
MKINISRFETAAQKCHSLTSENGIPKRHNGPPPLRPKLCLGIEHFHLLNRSFTLRLSFQLDSL